jgi:hypothetical protein
MAMSMVVLSLAVYPCPFQMLLADVFFRAQGGCTTSLHRLVKEAVLKQRVSLLDAFDFGNCEMPVPRHMSVCDICSASHSVYKHQDGSSIALVE